MKNLLCSNQLIACCGIICWLLVSNMALADDSRPSQLFKEPCESFNSATFDTPPTFVDSVAVHYPEIALRALIGGIVTVKAAVNPDGSFCSLILTKQVNPILNKAALTALRKSQMAPAHLDGEPTPGVIVVSYDFDLQKAQAAMEVRAHDRVRIKTKEEYLAMVEPHGNKYPLDFYKTFSLLGEGSTDFLISLLDHETYYVKVNAAEGLGRIGSPAAVRALIKKINNLPEGTEDWSFLVRALVIAGDRSVIPDLKIFEQRMRLENRIYGDSVLFAIHRIEHKDMARPLLLLQDGKLRFRFRLDEICRMYFMNEAKTFYQNGYMYSPNPEALENRTEFDQEDFRKICDFLSDGELQGDLKHNGRNDHLVIELCGGTHVALARFGDVFVVYGLDRDKCYNGFRITSPELAAFIDKKMGAE